MIKIVDGQIVREQGTARSNTSSSSSNVVGFRDLNSNVAQQPTATIPRSSGMHESPSSPFAGLSSAVTSLTCDLFGYSFQPLYFFGIILVLTLFFGSMGLLLFLILYTISTAYSALKNGTLWLVNIYKTFPYFTFCSHKHLTCQLKLYHLDQLVQKPHQEERYTPSQVQKRFKIANICFRSRPLDLLDTKIL